MTIMASSSILPTNLFGTDIELSKEAIQTFVEAGVIIKVENHTEHYAVQPCWIHDPGRGVMEEITGSVLGRWNNKLKAYVVHVDDVRSSERSAAMNEDHRWLHINIAATFYTYTPEAGQRLKGEIKKVGNSAAICIVFEVFTATVFAQDEEELKTWSIGDEIDFEVYSFAHRRKGPIVRARSIPSKGLGKNSDRNVSYALNNEESLDVLENGRDFDQAAENSQAEFSKSKKKKKDRRQREGDDESFELADETHMEVSYQNYAEHEIKQEVLSADDDTEVPSKKKKKKKKKSSHGE